MDMVRWCSGRWSGASGRWNRRRHWAVKTRQKGLRGRQSRCSTGKKYLAGLWGNSDFEPSQEVNAKDGTCCSSLQKLQRKKFALKLDSFLNESPRDDRLFICSFEKGSRWSGFGISRDNTQCCPSVNQILYLSLVSSSMRKNESSICWERHGRGSVMCWCCCRSGKGLAVF